MIKLIASDLDGTLIGRDFKFRPRTLAALKTAQDAGVQVVLVTGRPHRWLEAVVEQMDGYNSYAICSNGAVTYHLGRAEVVSTHTMAGREIHRVHQLLEKEFPEARFTAETLDTAYLQSAEDTPAQPGGPLENIELVYGALGEVLPADAQVVKYLMFSGAYQPETLLKKVRDIAGERVSVTHAVPGSPLIEMSLHGMNKGSVLAEFARERGITPDEVVAFGDMPNDTEMLRWAGRGYAMASGAPALIESVERVCPGFDEDGVAQKIEKLLGLSEGFNDIQR